MTVKMTVKFRPFIILALTLFLAPSAWAIELGMPIDCRYGKDCFIQNYKDVNPAKDERIDYNCGQLTYEGHSGTDFRVPWADYLAGVEVLAAADGVVLRTRDKMEDIDVRGREGSVRGVEAGNAVIVRHGDGYETVYAHLKLGSVRVKKGDKVKRGQVLGLVGMSGKTEFSHLHFGVMWKGNRLCPFKGIKNPDLKSCGPEKTSLWAPEILARLKYIPTGLLQAGFITYKPSLPQIVRDKPITTASPKAPILGYAVTVFGAQPGDESILRVFDPAGKLFATSKRATQKFRAQRLIFTGKKLKSGNSWSKGTYRGEFKLVRKGKVILTANRTIQVN